MATASKSYNRPIQPAAPYHPPPGTRMAKPGVTVLAISPFEADRIALRNIFSHSNWQLLEACSRRAAQPLIESHPPQVIICDTEIPDTTWQHILDELAGLENPPLLVVTSRLADEHLWAEVLNLGGYDVLMKPFDATEVVRVIGLAWRHHGEQAKFTMAASGA